MSSTVILCLFLVLIPYLYVRLNDAKLMQLPREVASAFSPKRISARDALEAAAISEKTTLDAKWFLPPRTGRRYIVVGGVCSFVARERVGSTNLRLALAAFAPLSRNSSQAGFLGGWIVRHLLERGEHPKQIRVLDIRAPTRPDLTTGLAKDIDFRLVDISDREQVQAAFNAPWPLGAPDFDAPDHGQDRGPVDNDLNSCRDEDSTAPELSADITVFHTAANIRFYERDPRLLHLSEKVNVEGTQNVLDAARAAGVRILIYTSSGSVSVRRTRLWLWPWEKRPVFWVQTIDDDDGRLPRRHEEMFSNYAASKIKAEGLVRAADRTPLAASAAKKGSKGQGQGLLRTGCLRPGNGIYGTGGDILCGAYLARQVNPSWAQDTLQNFIYVENASLAHFCYERRLIERARESTNNPDIGGQAFAIVDAGPPVTYGDVYTVLTTLTDGRTVFPRLSVTTMLMLAHVLERLYLLRSFATSSSNPVIRRLGQLVPGPTEDLVNLQPSLFFLTMVHLIWDDSRARLPPDKGGLGYTPQWTTLAALCKLVAEHKKANDRFEARSTGGGGISLGSMLALASRGVEKEIERFATDAALFGK
jgi:nucleoside-diphosphate-sugar epimerase